VILLKGLICFLISSWSYNKITKSVFSNIHDCDSPVVWEQTGKGKEDKDGNKKGTRRSNAGKAV